MSLLVLANAQNGGQGKNGYGGANIYYPIVCIPDSGANGGNVGSIFFQSAESSKFAMTLHWAIATGGKIGDTLQDYSYAVGYNLKNISKPYSYQSCPPNLTYIPQPGQTGLPGQICTKMNVADNFKCEKF